MKPSLATDLCARCFAGWWLLMFDSLYWEMVDGLQQVASGPLKRYWRATAEDSRRSGVNRGHYIKHAPPAAVRTNHSNASNTHQRPNTPPRNIQTSARLRDAEQDPTVQEPQVSSPLDGCGGVLLCKQSSLPWKSHTQTRLAEPAGDGWAGGGACVAAFAPKPRPPRGQKSTKLTDTWQSTVDGPPYGPYQICASCQGTPPPA